MWQQVYSNVHTPTDNNRVTINHEFFSHELIIGASYARAKPTWHRAGLIFPRFKIPGFGVVKGVGQKFDLATQYIAFLSLPNYTYTLEIYLNEWIEQIDLSFWENTNYVPENNVIRLEMLQRLALNNQEVNTLIQEQLDRIEQEINTTMGQ